jgi:hypothetical protein
MTLETLTGAVRNMPADSWLIFQMHSFDDEGYQPQPITRFESLCTFVASNPEFEVITIREGLGRICVGERLTYPAAIAKAMIS